MKSHSTAINLNFFVSTCTQTYIHHFQCKMCFKKISVTYIHFVPQRCLQKSEHRQVDKQANVTNTFLLYVHVLKFMVKIWLTEILEYVKRVERFKRKVTLRLILSELTLFWNCIFELFENWGNGWKSNCSLNLSIIFS